MICVSKCFGRKVPTCGFCGDCEHICGAKCPRLRRAKAIDRASNPVVYAVEKPKPLVRKMDFCALPECGKPYDVEHPLQKFCGSPCQKREKNVRAWAESRYRGAK